MQASHRRPRSILTNPKRHRRLFFEPLENRVCPSELFWADGSSQATFGANEPIAIDVGAIEFAITDEPGAISDSFYPAADIYVVPHGSVSRGETLTDVSGGRNTVIGASGGVFVSEIIGFAAPTGNIGAGVFDVVYDEWQNGVFDGPDALFERALTVTLYTDAPSVEPAIHAMKAVASKKVEKLAIALFGFKALFEFDSYRGWYDVVKQLPKLKSAELLDLVDLFYFGSDKIISRRLGIDPQEIAIQAIVNQLFHWGGIAADPPDPDFQQLTPVAPVAILSPDSNDLLSVAAAGIGKTSATEGSLAEALLHSLERYQGADAAFDGKWALLHARAAREYANLLADQLDTSSEALATFSDVLTTGSDGAELEAAGADLDAFTHRVNKSGFTDDEVLDLRNLGLDAADIEDLLALIAAQDFSNFSIANVQSTASDLIATNTDIVASLQIFVSHLDGIIATLQADPTVYSTSPVVVAGGPYVANEGASLTLNGAGSSSPHGTIVSYQWDLDRDGQFDDATGAAPTVSFTLAFDGLIGLKVIDDTGDVGIGYAWITVNNVNSPPTITPQAFPSEVVIGDTLSFGVSVSDPDGDQVNVAWLLDGEQVATGTTFVYQPASPDEVGIRSLRVVATDVSPLGGSTRSEWAVIVLAPDGDGDGWRMNVDCLDVDPTVNPGMPEIPDNGKDDDCNPDTPDVGPRPDLRADSVHASLVEGDWQSLHIGGVVEAEIANVGTADAGAFALTFFEDSNGNGTFDSGVDNILANVTQAGLAMGMTETVGAVISGSVQFRGNLIYVIVDSERAIAESNEVNNYSTTALQCIQGTGEVDFGTEITLPFWVPPEDINAIASADLNGDGFKDIVAVGDNRNFFSPGPIWVLLGNGDGSFQLTRYLISGVVSSVNLADFNGDGFLDVLAISNYSNVWVMLGNGNGTFAQPSRAGSAHIKSFPARGLRGVGRPSRLTFAGSECWADIFRLGA